MRLGLLPLVSVMICITSLLGPTRLLSQVPAQQKPLDQAHAHNDYLHERPLLDALEQGFRSVEADIFSLQGKLLVAHTPLEIRQERTLQALYLEPLRERVRAHGGSVFGDGQPFHLLIDLKTPGEPSYEALDKVLAEYAEMLATVNDGQFTSGAVEISISGNRPIAMITTARRRYAGLDGRLSDLHSSAPRHLMPLISDSWTSHFNWRGTGELPPEERQKLSDYVQRAHAAGRKIRFWGSPDTPQAWQEFQAAGVDLINTDNLAGLATFLRAAEMAVEE